MNITVLGMGRMGQALCERLLEQGCSVTVWNRTRGRAEEVVRRGADESVSIREAMAEADVVLTSLSNDEAVLDIANGPDGIRANIHDALYVDCSTVSPETSARLAAEFDRFVAMPIMGSPEAVAAGDATYLAGGSDELVAELRPLLDQLSAQRHTYGAPALASAAKLASNLFLLAAVTGLSEGVAVGRAGGLSVADLRTLFAESPLLGPGLKNRVDSVVDGHGPLWWDVSLGVKDAAAALGVAHAAGVTLPIAHAVQLRYQAAVDRGLGDQDIAAVTTLYAQEAGPPARGSAARLS